MSSGISVIFSGSLLAGIIFATFGKGASYVFQSNPFSFAFCSVRGKYSLANVSL